MKESKLPDFLIEMSKQLNTQDNRITADPIFNVQYDAWITCADDRGEKSIIIVSSDDHQEFEIGDVAGFCEYFSENHPSWVGKVEEDKDCHLREIIGEQFSEVMFMSGWPEGVDVERIEMQKVQKVVKSCLTESDAKAFITRKQHDYPKLYVYVTSMCYCPQMIELRNWIKGLKGDSDGQ